jgi:hypothetical protein
VNPFGYGGCRDTGALEVGAWALTVFAAVPIFMIWSLIK